MDIFNTYDWTKFVCRININTTPERVYDAWTKPCLLEKWFLSEAKFTPKADEVRQHDDRLKKDDNYEWHWHGYSKAVNEKGTIIEANGTDLLQFTFSGDTLVTVIIKSEEGETVVELWQENIPKTEIAKIDYHLNCKMGWTFYLTNLKSYLEGGIDLRNKNEALTDMINV